MGQQDVGIATDYFVAVMTEHVISKATTDVLVRKNTVIDGIVR